jgi:hypothetical protein
VTPRREAPEKNRAVVPGLPFENRLDEKNA